MSYISYKLLHDEVLFHNTASDEVMFDNVLCAEKNVLFI